MVALCGDQSMVHICLENVVESINAPIVVGTPFRLLDALKGECMDRAFVNKAMQDLEYLVLDEIDRMIPMPGRYARAEERSKLLQRSNPSIELIRFIVKHKEYQLMNINRGLLSYQWERSLPLQVVAASATVGRPLLRELNKLFYSYQVRPFKMGQEPEVVPLASRGSLAVFRPDDAVPMQALQGAAVNRATNKAPRNVIATNSSSGRFLDDMIDDDDDDYDLTGGEKEARISRSIGIPTSIRHMALLKPPVDQDDHSDTHMAEGSLNIKHLELLKDYWVYQQTSLKRGLLFVPTVRDVVLAVHMFRKWRVREAVDLQWALGLMSRKKDGALGMGGGGSGDSAAAAAAGDWRPQRRSEREEDASQGARDHLDMGTSALIERAIQRGIGGGTGAAGAGGLVRELFIAPESAARGLHLQDLDCVMIFKLPTDMDQYLHMAGRTGRLSSVRTSQKDLKKEERDRVVTIVDDQEYTRLTCWQTPLGIKIEPIGSENAKLHLTKAKYGPSKVVTLPKDETSDNAASRSRGRKLKGNVFPSLGKKPASD